MQIREAFILSKRNQDGSPGKPIGISAVDDANNDGGMLLFENLGQAKAVLDSVLPDVGPLSIFKVSVTLLGEVVA